MEFRNLGEQLLAVAKHEKSRVLDPRLAQVEKRAAVTPAGASEAVPSEGGFLVAPEFSRDLFKRAYNTGQILKRCFEMPMKGGNTLKFPAISETSRASGSRMGGVQTFWEKEGETLNVPSGTYNGYTMKPGFEQAELTAKKLTGLLALTDELAMDTDAFDAWANYAFSQELAFTIENAIINSTGAGTLRGILTAPALVSVAKQSGQAAGSIVGLNVTGMVKSLWAASRMDAIWLYNQQALDQLMTLQLVVGSGGSQANLWQNALEPGMPDMLAGIAAYPSEYCQAPGTPGDLILADFKRYAVGIREWRGDVSIHVLFNADGQMFKFVVRMDGMPVDQAPVTPLYGTNKTSPFVALAAR